MINVENLYSSPNALAKYYRKFKVSERLLFTGHSHQAWPDCGFEGQKKAWFDAAEFVDNKWEKAFEKAEAVKKGFSKLLDDENGHITLGQNTHELVVRFLSALPLKKKPKLITTYGEFHTIRRQLDRLQEEDIEIIKIPTENLDELPGRIIEKIDDNTAAVLVSKVFFKTGQIAQQFSEVLSACKQFGAELLIDVYHVLNVTPFSVKNEKLEEAFFVGGGYKYCQLGEGNCFLRFPKECKLRPVITGWYSEFSALSNTQNKNIVNYGRGSDLFAGATYDPTSNYRAAEVFNFFHEQNLTPEFLRKVSKHQIELISKLFDEADLDKDKITRDYQTSLKNIAGFLVLTSSSAGEISNKLKKEGVFTDFRGKSLRIGPAPYISDEQIKSAMDKLIKVARSF